MASDLIEGIDNSCEAVRAAVRRAEERGVVWRSPPLIKAIGNDSEALRRAERAGVAWPKALVIKAIGNDCAAVRATALRAERNSGTPSAVPRRRRDDALEVCTGASGTRRKEIGRRVRAWAVALGWVPSVDAEHRDMTTSGRPAMPAVSTDTAPTRILRR